MDKKIINEEQFRKMVIEEAKKFISEEEATPVKTVKTESKRKITFDKVESLINEMEGMNKSISSLSIDADESALIGGSKSSDEHLAWTPKKSRDLDVNEHNKNKITNHINEGEKDKYKRMLNYEVPSDEDR